jgi:hypothetical protein
VNHLSFVFSSLEEGNDTSLISWVIATGIEAGMLAIAFGIAERRRSNKGITDLIFYLLFFASINFYGNFYYAVSVYTKVRYLKMEHVVSVDYLILFTIAFLSGCLPLLALALTELQSIFGLKYRQEQDLERRTREKELAEKKKEEAKTLRAAEVTPKRVPDNFYKPAEIEDEEDEPIVEAPFTAEEITASEPPTIVDVVARRKAAHNEAVKKKFQDEPAPEDNLPKVKNTASQAELAQMSSPQEELTRVPIEQELGGFPYSVFDKASGGTIPMKKG